MPSFEASNIGDLLPSEFILFSDHQALRFIQGQNKLNPRHAKWVELLQDFSLVIRHKSGATNTVVDALSRRRGILTPLQTHVDRFDALHTLYADDLDFASLWVDCRATPTGEYSMNDVFLFKGIRLCVPICSVRDAIILEGHQGALAGCFGWALCHIAKAHQSNAGLYTQLSVLAGPWEDASLDFVVGLPKT
ncbi:hypothetical protein OSB04_un000033 [Centaurea solstitialis]|uniref:Reverse transcriptase RNase H-like domain-containing protein n=1 Tax=Centaurea solstitialis TaxID=347529 RepID=A0AA38W431_9ASTR|nr:hypothetical protein OSB04_un000033 [Centaurea solstitialis]